MDAEAVAWAGGIAGAVMGLAGGLLGTWASIHHCRGPRERAYVIRASLVCWALIGLFLAGIFLIPTWHRHLLWIPYVLGLSWGIRSWNRRQQELREEESREVRLTGGQSDG
jgi:hypothetical protein